MSYDNHVTNLLLVTCFRFVVAQQQLTHTVQLSFCIFAVQLPLTRIHIGQSKAGLLVVHVIACRKHQSC